MYNKFCPTPIILIPEIFDKTETWPFPIDKTYFSKSSEIWNLKLKSEDGSSSVRISKNGIMIKVEFPIKLEIKTPVWVEEEKGRWLKIVQTYAKVSQIYSISDVPD